MKRPIVEILLLSEKRKNVLLLLQAGPKEMQELIGAVDTTRTILLPQMKVLKESHLISQHDDTYELTTIGKLIVEKMADFLGTAEMFGENSDYLGTHNIDFIPQHLLKELPEIGSCEIVNIPLYNIFDQDIELLQKALRSKRWLEITSVLYPTFYEFYAQMIENEIDTSVIITQEFYDKAKKEYYHQFKDIINLKLITLYLYPEKLDFTSFILAGECMSFRLFTNEGEFDHRKMQICGPAVPGGGKELFEYYRQRSTLIIDI
ncbi:helix-turn-helix transcriptional regulator [Methanolobus chelungpuianus]|uniref:Transcriptional regulator n=1 Tax=Methanolobus chelungpuianus TaxID=502115 RepID=A0AAE3KYD0_9EURY|nr:winged helix-turn-helix domain-containing protein [Methanolobus chelungpuianus]MCQ6963875.1 hypothetical protein [Methanolobus chelungpuianus]